MVEGPGGADPATNSAAFSGSGRATNSIAVWSLIIGAGFFATTLVQIEILDILIRDHLRKAGLVNSVSEMGDFFLIAGIPWYLKAFAGFVSDNVPLFGTRRRHYLIFGAFLVGAFWLLAGVSSRSYLSFLAAVMAMSSTLVVLSTVLGSLVVEAGQKLQAAGRLTSVRSLAENGCMVAAGLVGGYLATLAFVHAAMICALIVVSVVPIFYFLLVEAPVKIKTPVRANARNAFLTLRQASNLWTGAKFILLLGLPQAVYSALNDFQAVTLHLDVRDIGLLRTINGSGAVLASVVYAYACRRLPLKVLLVAGLACGAAGMFGYGFYSVARAPLVEFAGGFLMGFLTLSLLQITVWATPGAAAALGFSILMSAWNLGNAIGDWFATRLIDTWSFSFHLVAFSYGAVTAVLIVTVKALPAELFMHVEAGGDAVNASADRGA